MTENNQLSDRELEILKLVATGASNKEIARELTISVNTVKVHLRNIFSKLEVASRTEATMWAVRTGVVSPEIELTDDLQQDITEEETPSRWKNWSLWLAFGAAILIIVVTMSIWFAQQRNSENAVEPDQSAETQRWHELANLSTPRSRFASAEYENQIYAIGGQTKEGITNLVERYDVQSDLWINLSSKKVPVADIHAAVIGGNIFVPGGLDESDKVTNVVEVYNPYEDQWETVAPLPKALSAYAMVAYEGRLFVFGGWDGQHYLNTVYVYDPVLDQWSERTPMPTPRAYAGAAVVQGKIYVVGGEINGEILSVNEEYWPEIDNGSENPWSSREGIPEPLAHMGVDNVADILHIVGGGETNNYRYYPRENIWSPFPTYHEHLWEDLGLVSLGSNLFAFGGQQEENLVDVNFSYQAIYIISIPVSK